MRVPTAEIDLQLKNCMFKAVFDIKHATAGHFTVRRLTQGAQKLLNLIGSPNMRPNKVVKLVQN